MRKVFLGVALLVALMIPAVAVPATLHEAHIGTSCEGDGTFHFVQNQTGGSQADNTLTANFSGGVVVALQDKVTPGGTYHWTVIGNGTLEGASTSVAAGKLVLSDFECVEKKEDPKE